MDLGNTSEALKSYGLAMDLLDSHYQLVTDISQTLMRHDMQRAAEGLLRHAWRAEPAFALAPGLLARIYSEWGQADRAERFSRLALTIDESRSAQAPHHLSGACRERAIRSR